MSDLKAVLDRIRKRREATTKGPWRYRCGTINTRNGGALVTKLPSAVSWADRDADGDFLAHSWADIGTLLAIVESLATIDEAVKEAAI